MGTWGGTCRCPDGNTYEVGDNNNACKSLACINGKMVNCNKESGEWSRRKVTCKGILLLSVISWLSLYHNINTKCVFDLSFYFIFTIKRCIQQQQAKIAT